MFVKFKITCIIMFVSSSVSMEALTLELPRIEVRVLVTVCNVFWKLVRMLTLILLVDRIRSPTFSFKLLTANLRYVWAWRITSCWSEVTLIEIVLKLIIFKIYSNIESLSLRLLALKPENLQISNTYR